jgi:Tfp pilus assembly protein PilV
MRRTPFTRRARSTTPTDTCRRRRDAGVSLVEILIAIVLISTVVVATLTALRTTIMASAADRDHANAHAWLQTAADMLYARDLITCGSMDPGNPANDIALIANEYEKTIQQTDNPEGWSAPNISVIGLEWWSIDINSSGVGTEAWGTVCDAKDTNLQKVELQVTAESGRIVEEVEVIIGG